MMRLRRIGVLFVCFPIVAGGCSFNPPKPETERMAARLTGVSDLAIVASDGLPLDSQGVSPVQLTLSDAVRLALATSPEIQAALARVRTAYAESKQSRLLPNPVLSVVVKFPTSGGAPTIEPGIAADLLAILQKPKDVNISDNRLRAASAEAVSTVLDVVARVENVYAGAQSLESLVPVLQERRKLTLRLLDIAKARYGVGEATRFDVASLESQLIELDVEISENTLALRESRLELANLIGRPSDEAVWVFDAQVEPAILQGDTLPWVQAGLNHRPEIDAKTWELAALGAEFKRARWDLLAGTEVGINAEGTANSNADDWALGPALAVPIPIFDWGQARLDVARSKQTEATHQLTQIRRQVVEEIRRAHAVYRSTYDTYQRVTSQLIPLLERRRQLAESQYRAGVNDVESLILAHQELQAALAKQVGLKSKSAVALAQLRRAAGGRGVAPALTESAPETAASRPATAAENK